MLALIHAVLLMFVIKGLTYFFFPNWVKQYHAENIVECPVGRLKMLGMFFMIMCLIMWVSWVQYL